MKQTFAYLEAYDTPTLDERLAQQRAHWERIKRECLEHDLKLSFDYAEAAFDHERELRQAGHDTRKELKAARVTAHANLTMILACLREQGVDVE